MSTAPWSTTCTHNGKGFKHSSLRTVVSFADTWSRWLDAEDLHFARYLAHELTFEDQRRNRVRDFLAEPLDDAEADAWFAGYLTHFEAAWRLFDDVLPALDLLAGLPIAVFSNVSGEYTRRKINAVGLSDRFAVTWGLDDAGSAKPDARNFLSVCAAMQVNPTRVVHVGDRYETDALGACDAGLVSVWIDRTDAMSGLSAVDPRVTVVTSLVEGAGRFADERRFG